MSTKHHERRSEAGGHAPEGHPAAGGVAEGGMFDVKAQTKEVESLNEDSGSAKSESSSAEAATGSMLAEKSARELSIQVERAVKAEASAKVLAEENASLKDQYLRKLADYENFRKRMFREKEEVQKYAVVGLLGDLVPVLDDFDRAIASAEHARDYTVLHDGVLLIKRQIASLLENKHGLVRFESLGKLFDPNIHEAVASDCGEVEDATVVEEFLPGYRLHDRVVRSAKVKIRMPSPNSGASVSSIVSSVLEDGSVADRSAGSLSESVPPGETGAASKDTRE